MAPIAGAQRFIFFLKGFAQEFQRAAFLIAAAVVVVLVLGSTTTSESAT